MTAIISDSQARPQPSSRLRGLRSLLFSQETILALTLLALVVLVGAANPRFLAERNMSDVLQGNAYIAIAAIGMTMVIVSGNIDISIGSAIGVLATMCGLLATESGLPVVFSWLLPLLGGLVIGAINGFLVAYIRIPSIVVTLGMLSILKGGLILYRGGETIYNLPPGFGLAQERPLGIPSPVWFMVILTIVAAIWMRYSPTGRAIYAVGGNKEAATLSGINTRRVIMQVFLINGFFAGIAGVLYATQFTSIQAVVPPGIELSIITASVVGGVSILGGTGTVIGSTLAAILLRAIGSALVFINISPYWLRAVQGVLILVTVLVDMLRRRGLRR
jgi:ribose/xylose/arabinose/galactoside ABC-type transport system permease subunit